jgi:multidrug transporter EmrE-like cation transporter
MYPVAWMLLAIGSEVIATTALKASDGFSRWQPVIVVVVGYGLSFFALSMALRSIPLGVVYAVWSGVGTAVIALIGVVFFKETLGLAGVAGIALIVVGVALLNLVGARA